VCDEDEGKITPTTPLTRAAGVRVAARLNNTSLASYEQGQRAQTGRLGSISRGLPVATPASAEVPAIASIIQAPRALSFGHRFRRQQGHRFAPPSSRPRQLRREKAGYGNLVEIDHGNGLVTRYGHARA